MSGGFVLDASATLAWCFADEATSATESLLERLRSGEPAFVPAHWPTEVMNTLLFAARKERITTAKIVRFAQALSAVPVHIELPWVPISWDTLLTFAAETRLTVYDAAYLELAQRTGLPLATLDRELHTAAQMLSVQLVDLV